MKYLAIRLLYLLGYCWSAITVVFGLALLAVAAVTGCIVSTEWSGPALIVRLRGRWATWMQTPNASGTTYFAHTIGLAVFAYRDLDEKPRRHEIHHVWQQMILGPFDLVIYAVSIAIGLIRYGSWFPAYRNCVLERDARRAAGEPV